MNKMTMSEKRAKQKRIDMLFQTILAMLGMGWGLMIGILVLEYMGRL